MKDKVNDAVETARPYVERLAKDDELHEHFIANGLGEDQAWQALTYRALYLRHVFLEGFTPILKGHEALCFDPHSRGWEPVPPP